MTMAVCCSGIIHDCQTLIIHYAHQNGGFRRHPWSECTLGLPYPGDSEESLCAYLSYVGQNSCLVLKISFRQQTFTTARLMTKTCTPSLLFFQSNILTTPSLLAATSHGLLGAKRMEKISLPLVRSVDPSTNDMVAKTGKSCSTKKP